MDMLPYFLLDGEAFRLLNFTDPRAIRKYRLKSKKYFRTTLTPQTYEKLKFKVKDLTAKCKCKG